MKMIAHIKNKLMEKIAALFIHKGQRLLDAKPP